MSILVKNAGTEKKIRRLAKRTGETITAAIDRAVDDRLAKLGPDAGRRDGWIAGSSPSYSLIFLLFQKRTSI